MREICCHIPFQNMVIDADGNVTPCPYIINDPNLPNTMGNVNEKSILEVWNSQEYQQLRKFMLSEEGKNGCQNCLYMRQSKKSDALKPRHHNEPGYQDKPAWKNYELCIQEIDEKKTILSCKPAVISYTPNHSCNFRCIMCYQSHTRNVSLEHSEKTNKELMELVPYLVELIAGGGEPFIQPIWKDFLEKTNDAYPLLTFSATTNGSMLNKKMVKKLDGFSYSLINFSYDATYKELFEKIRKNANFERVHENLLFCIDHMNQIGADRFYTTASMTVMKENFKDVKNMLDFMWENRFFMNFSGLVVYPLSQSLISYTYPENETLSLQEIQKEMDVIKRLLAEKYSDPFMDIARTQLISIFEQIPFYLLTVKHYLIAGRVPNFHFSNIIQMYQSNSNLQIAFAAIQNGQIGKAHWYSPVDQNGFYSAYLPDGCYATYVGKSNMGVSPTDAYFTITVKNGRMRTNVHPRYLFCSPLRAMKKMIVSLFRRK